MKNKKRVIVDIVVAVVMIVLIVSLTVFVSKYGDKKAADGKNGNNIETYNITNKQGKVVQTITGSHEQIESYKKDQAKKQKDGWGGVKVEEATDSKEDKNEVQYKVDKNGETVTNKKGEPVTRKTNYPGQSGGWSPIVTPEDLKKDK